MKKLFIVGSAIIALTLFVNSRTANHIQQSSIACGGCTNNVLACGGCTNSAFNGLLALQ